MLQRSSSSYGPPDEHDVRLLEVTTPMIAISDNTAADHLMTTSAARTSKPPSPPSATKRPALNIPFLTTRRVLPLQPRRQRHLPRGRRPRQANLPRLPRRTIPSLADAAQWAAPRRIEDIEWFASSTELCRLMAALDQTRQQPGLEPLASVLSQNPGLPIDASAFPYIAFKGGSEPGVLNLTWLVHTQSGARYFVSFGLNDPTAPTAKPPPSARPSASLVCSPRARLHEAHRHGCCGQLAH